MTPNQLQTETKRPGRPKGINTFTIAFEADKRIKDWYDSLPEKKSEIIRNILNKTLDNII